jgi:alkanesulfonate monooxygenase SsuD/methylene tetrahydromethanopterin reductase-like flavin-dependent oxidoreductase (luciferase family)
MVASLLISKKPDFSFLEPLGLEMSPELKDLVMGATYGIGSDSTLRVAAKIPDAFADALTVAGTADDVISSICRMARRGVGQLMVYPIPCPGTNSEQVLERLATDVMPIVNATLLGRQ